MKKILGLTFILLAVVNIFAQEKTIEKSEFDKVFQASFGKRSGKSYRKTTTMEHTFQGGTSTVGYLSKSTSEFQSRIGYHSVYEAKLSSGNKKIERIVIGDKLYTREGDGEWKAGSIEPPPAPEGTIKTLSKETEYKFWGNEILNNQNTTVYLVVEKSKTLNEKNNIESIVNATTKYWFAEDGALLKTEKVRTFQSGEAVSTNKEITIYELDPNIKIEAPAVK